MALRAGLVAGIILPSLAILLPLHVGPALSNGRRPLVDTSAREVQLRGTCLESESRSGHQRSHQPQDYANGSCPDNFGGFRSRPFALSAPDNQCTRRAVGGRNDFAQAREAGLNVQRICLSWSNGEPTAGVYDPVFFARKELSCRLLSSEPRSPHRASVCTSAAVPEHMSTCIL